MIYWTSDWHLNHSNIIRYTYRPQLQKGDINIQGNWISQEIAKARVQEMNTMLINRCNERVKAEDTLFFIGDIGMKSNTDKGNGEPEKLQDYLSKINCKNIIYISGNHDVKGRNGFKTIIKKIIIYYGGFDICLVHDPKYCEYKYKLNLVGHVHNNWLISQQKQGHLFTTCYNVGVDMHNFYPITFNEIMSDLSKGERNEKNF